jgi:hypothetical protein
MTTPNKTLPQYEEFAEQQFTEWYFSPPTCELLEAVLYNVSRAGTPLCLSSQDHGYFCGCNGFSDSTSYRRILLAWLPRISSILSIFVSSV